VGQDTICFKPSTKLHW